MGASITTGVAFIVLVKGKLIIRSVQHCLIAGLVLGGTASHYVTVSGMSIMFGLVAAVMQIGFD